MGWDEATNAPLYQGGKCFIELLDNNTLQATIYLDDDQFSDIKRELNRIARKRLAIGIILFGIAAVLIGVLK